MKPISTPHSLAIPGRSCNKLMKIRYYSLCKVFLWLSFWTWKLCSVFQTKCLTPASSRESISTCWYVCTRLRICTYLKIFCSTVSWCKLNVSTIPSVYTQILCNWLPICYYLILTCQIRVACVAGESLAGSAIVCCARRVFCISCWISSGRVTNFRDLWYVVEGMTYVIACYGSPGTSDYGSQDSKA